MLTTQNILEDIEAAKILGKADAWYSIAEKIVTSTLPTPHAQFKIEVNFLAPLYNLYRTLKEGDSIECSKWLTLLDERILNYDTNN